MYFLTKSLQYTQEIRYRIIFCLITLITTFIVSFIFREELLFLIIKPLITLKLNETTQIITYNLIFLNITEAFETYMYISFYCSLAFTLQILIFQLFSFLAEALYKKEKHYLLFFLIISFLIFILLFILIYNFLIPIIWNFFIYFQNNNLNSFQLEFIAQLSIYIHFFLNLILKLIILLTIPFFFGIFITFLKINIYKIIKNRPFFIFGNLLLATLVSPPDVFSQLFITLLLTIFFEIIFLYNLIVQKYS